MPPTPMQHCEPLALMQSALSRQMVCVAHVGAHAICWLPAPSQQLPPLQSSTPSHVAAMPAHAAPLAMHDGAPMKSKQHF